MSDHDSDDSNYKSAPSSSGEEDFHHDDDDGLDDEFHRPNVLPGSSESSLIQVIQFNPWIQKGATMFSIMTFSMTITKWDTQHLIIMQSAIMLSVFY